jgi:hypothetical protein
VLLSALTSIFVGDDLRLAFLFALSVAVLMQPCRMPSYSTGKSNRAVRISKRDSNCDPLGGVGLRTHFCCSDKDRALDAVIFSRSWDSKLRVTVRARKSALGFLSSRWQRPETLRETKKFIHVGNRRKVAGLMRNLGAHVLALTSRTNN